MTRALHMVETTTGEPIAGCTRLLFQIEPSGIGLARNVVPMGFKPALALTLGIARKHGGVGIGKSAAA